MEMATQKNLRDLVAHLDPSISPAADFYAHVNQRWCETNPIPDKEGRWGAFLVLREETKHALHALLEELAQAADLPDGGKKKLRDLYLLGMDEARLERDGLLPLRYILESIGEVRFPREVIILAAKLHRINATPFFGSAVFPATKKSDTNRLSFAQAGLSLPDRNYYLSDDPKFAGTREAFLSYMQAVHGLLGD